LAAEEQAILEKILAALKGSDDLRRGKMSPEDRDKEDAEQEKTRARRTRDNIAVAETQEEINKAKLDHHRQYIKTMKESLAEENEGTAAYKKKVQAIKKGTKANREATTALQKHNREMGHGARKAGLLTESILGINGQFEQFMKFVPTSRAELKGFFKEMKNVLKPTKLLGALLMKVISNSVNFALSVDKAGASFRAATGAGYEYQNVISNAGSAYLTYGINAEDAGKATQALFSHFRDFTGESDTTKERLAATVAILGKFNVSMDESTANLNTMTKSLGFSTKQSERLLREFDSIATAVGKPISEISKDFAAAAPKLAFYGKEMLSVFKELEAQSKSTGLSVDQLLGVFGEQFDTFEGAGKAVGKLNALMGGPYLNSIDMLNASESERLEMVQESLKASGLVFNDLNKYEQKAFASAIGTDVDTLRKSLNELTPFEEARLLRQEQLARKAGQARDVLQKLKDAFNSLIIKNQDFADKIVKLIDRFSDWVHQGHDLKDLFCKIFGCDGKPGYATPWIDKIKQIGWAILAVKGALMAFQVVGIISRMNLMGNAAVANGAKMSAMGMAMRGALGLAVAGAGMYATSKGAQALHASGRTEEAASLSKWGGAASGAAGGAMAGSMFGPMGTLIGAGLGGLGGYMYGSSQADDLYGGRYNDARIDILKDGKPISGRQGIRVNSSDDARLLVGTPTGPLAQGSNLFGNSSAGSSDQATLMRQNITEPLIKALKEMNLSADIRLEGDMKNLLNVVNSPEGKKQYLPFYNR